MIPKISGSEVKSFVKASMNLAGSENQKMAAKLQKEMKFADTTSSMEERVDSYISSKAPLSLPKVVKSEEIIPQNQERVDSYISSKAPLSLPKEKAAEEIIPENSINFIA